MIPNDILFVKEQGRLEAALTAVEFLRDEVLPDLKAEDTHGLRLVQETRNMVLNAEMRLRASLYRTESRGNHFREDYPARDDGEWLAWVKIREENGRMVLEKVPIPEDCRPDPSLPYEKRYPLRYPGELEFMRNRP
jgi:succinate dehydrogenase/fumarate reductase flavoprotein subunit